MKLSKSSLQYAHKSGFCFEDGKYMQPCTSTSKYIPKCTGCIYKQCCSSLSQLLYQHHANQQLQTLTLQPCNPTGSLQWYYIQLLHIGLKVQNDERNIYPADIPQNKVFHLKVIQDSCQLNTSHQKFGFVPKIFCTCKRVSCWISPHSNSNTCAVPNSNIYKQKKMDAQPFFLLILFS